MHCMEQQALCLPYALISFSRRSWTLLREGTSTCSTRCITHPMHCMEQQALCLPYALVIFSRCILDPPPLRRKHTQQHRYRPPFALHGAASTVPTSCPHNILHMYPGPSSVKVQAHAAPTVSPTLCTVRSSKHCVYPAPSSYSPDVSWTLLR
jgi:hypothetical protein